MAPTNALAGEKSPYLVQHKDNPVAWQPWGAAAFDLAKRGNKPVFLSIGYSTCHWCHVMAHESFENPAIAALMNREFVNIKVDREERPDVDRVYMAFVQATTGSGGWPMSVWLTPEGHPFFGGTYFPPEDRYGRAGFPRILQQIGELWRQDRARIEGEAARVLAALRESDAPRGRVRDLQADWIQEGRQGFARIFDRQHGGFGGAPKFPRPSSLNLLMRGDEAAREMALTTLRAMSHGGMRDHLGGGFHRYSVDERWHVPHFEKMLYDQAQVTASLVEAWQLTGDAFFESTARSTLDYVLRDMTHPSGGFYSAEDADSLLAHGSTEHAEGAFYVWSKREVEEALTPTQATRFCEHYHVREDGNVAEGGDPHGEFTGKNILFETSAPDACLAEAREVLLAVRARRPRPHLDDKILTAWNGLMISALAKAARAFGDPRYLAGAKRAADFLLTHLQKDGDLLRSWRGGASDIPGYAEDFAFFIQGLLDLYEADFDTRWLLEAERLQARQDELFWSGSGYFGNREGDPLVPVRMREDYDGAEPAADSLSATNLLRLARIAGLEGAEGRAREVLLAHTTSMDRTPTAVPQMLVALEFALTPASQIITTGNATRTNPLIERLDRDFLPFASRIHLGSPEAHRFFAARLPFLREVDWSVARLYRCENFTCSLPVEI